MNLEQQIELLESYISKSDILDANVSRQPVGWHVHHSLKVIYSVLTALERSDPAKYKWKFNLTRAVFLTVGWFPRGKAKAPKIARPPEEVDLNLIREELEAVRRSLILLEGRSKNSYFRHPYFGKLNMPNARKFLGDHTHHHLKIIKDIIGQAGA